MGAGGSVEKAEIEKDVEELAGSLKGFSADELQKLKEAVEKAEENRKNNAEEATKMANNYTDTLGMNMRMWKGAKLVSANGQFTAVFQEDQNFVVYKGDEPLWASNTVDCGADRLILQGDQHLVMYNGEEPTWSTDVFGKGKSPVKLVMQDDGNLVQYNSSDEPMWVTRTEGGKSPDEEGKGEKCMEDVSEEEGDKMAWGMPKLGENMGLLKGGMLISANKEYTAVFQGDQHFVVYKGDEPLWGSKTCDCEADVLVLQGDQHLVMYKGDEATWSTDVFDKGNSPVKLVLQDDGNLVQYNANDEPMWCTRTEGGPNDDEKGEKCME